jgi:hypothetical protein
MGWAADIFENDGDDHADPDYCAFFGRLGLGR